MKGRLIYVVGPSGAGKDSLLHFAREHVAGTSVVFAHRYITRETGHNENHIALTREEFTARSAQGLFALEWSSHELHYGIGIEIDAWLERGCTVVVNGSRAYLARALKRYQHLEVVHIHAAPHILAQRLSTRGRETAEQVAARGAVICARRAVDPDSAAGWIAETRQVDPDPARAAFYAEGYAHYLRRIEAARPRWSDPAPTLSSGVR